MARTDLNIELKLNDKASKGIKKTQKEITTFSEKIKKNWVGITAGVVSAGLAMKKAFDFIERGGKIEQQRVAFANLASSMGGNAEKILADVQKMSGGTISSFEAMQQSSRAMTLGLDPTQLGRMMEIARASARAMGQDVDFMFESIALGIGRQSKMILDNLGIIVNAEQAYNTYAKVLGKSSSQLTDAEKRQAFMNATMKAGEGIIKKVGIQGINSSEKLQQLKVAAKELGDKFASSSLDVFMFASQMFDSNSTLVATGKLLETLSNGLIHTISVIKILGEATIGVQARFFGAMSAGVDMGEALEIALEGTGQAIEKTTTKWGEAMTEMAKSANEPKWQMKGVKSQIEEVETTVVEFSDTTKDIFKEMGSSLGDSFGEMFYSFAKGINDTRSIMKSFADDMLRMITKVIAKLILARTLSSVGGYLQTFGGGLGLLGSGISAIGNGISGKAIGTDRVAQDGVFRLHKGEKVVPANQANDYGGGGVGPMFQQKEAGGPGAGGGGGQNIFIFKMWDASDMVENKRMLMDIIGNAISSNHSIRGSMRKFI